ncbi:hypothetical protein ACQKGO_25290 [Corallococcus interemptor]|uniref:hypothetical protein n=1 Tax=Corallococcus interemptor TaxID=2316720 RepID=UPI003CFE1D70
MLVAQAPESGAQEVPFPATPFPDGGLDARIQELTQRVGLLQEEIEGIRLGRPRGSKLMTTLEAELRDLRARRDGMRSRQWQPRPSIPLVAVNF